MIKDSNLDFDRHLGEFRSIVDCYALNRRTLAVGSICIKIYDNMIAQAQKDRRLPFQAQAVYDDTLAKMKSVPRERAS